MEMLATQAAHREDRNSVGNEDSIVANKNLPEAEKSVMLQRSLHMAASNGDVDRVRRLVEGDSRDYISINAADEEGTAPLIYASCFVGLEIVTMYGSLVNCGFRAIKMSFWPCSTQMCRSTVRIRINGQR